MADSGTAGGNNPQLFKACTLFPTSPSSGLPPRLGLPVAPPSTDSNQVSSAPITQEESGKDEMAKAPQATRVPQLCPLQEVGGEFGPIKVRAPFSFSDLKQIKADIGKVSDDLGKYIDVLQGLDQSL
ncbi:hypothetical protein AAY473_024625 [Plecturocebus cupreus]